MDFGPLPGGPTLQTRTRHIDIEVTATQAERSAGLAFVILGHRREDLVHGIVIVGHVNACDPEVGRGGGNT